MSPIPWFKVDDKHHDHKKTRKALRGVPGKRRCAGAMGLWELAGSWSADNLQDGFVPEDELFRWDDDWETLAARLVDAEYWVTAVKEGEPGFQFVNWEEHQPMKSDVEAKREAARERMRNMRRGSSERSQDVRANSERTSREVREPRPVPSRPVPSPSTDVDVSDDDKPSRTTKGRATRRPEDFRPHDGHVALADELGIDLVREFAQFCDHHDAKGSRYVDWSKALFTWIRNAQRFGGGRGQSASTPKSPTGWLAAAEQLRQEEA